MAQAKRFPILFSDLDGTLLDHHDYSFDTARTALTRLRQAGIPLVLNTSKTVSEVLAIRRILENRHPFLVENGSALLIPQYYFPRLAPGQFTRFERSAEPLLIHYFGRPYAQVCELLYGLRARHKLHFRGFAEMSDSEVAQLTGLDPLAAARARERLSGEPIHWRDSPRAKIRLCQALAEHDLILLQGGRFLHVMSRVDKALGVDWLMRSYQELYRQLLPDHAIELVSVALGDSPNDLGMLKASDIAVAIPPFNGAALAIPMHKRTIRPTRHGPAGWQQAVEQILTDYDRPGVNHG